jgi:alanine-glyoxylate transaminase/serine-glyoxylate transaminase/serine-pyruvate transaminase
MTLANGRPYLAIPGPSVMPDRVLNAMHRASPNIYAGELVEMTESLIPDLRAVARAGGDVAIYVGNGHAAWEAALCNVLSRGDRVLALATGRFGHGWAAMAEGLGAAVEIIDFGKRAPADPGRLRAALQADADHRIRAVLVTHVDTATSIRNDIAALAAERDALGHPALILVDCIASLACDRFEMDAWGADVMVAGSQKGLMTPPGLGLVWFNARAAAARARAGMVTPYWDWAPRTRPGAYYEYFCGHRADPSSLRAARGARHDRRRGGSRRCGPGMPGLPALSGPRRRPGGPGGRCGSTWPNPRIAAMP